MTVQEYLNKTRKIMWSRIRPYIHCPDGFEISVQASAIHYCIPRRDNAEFYKNVYKTMGNTQKLKQMEEQSDMALKRMGSLSILKQKIDSIVNVPDRQTK